MSNDVPAQAQIYPAYCFAASPSYFSWVKLTAVDVHGLRAVPPFEDQQIYFHLNHPIRYVYVCGLIVDITFFPKDTASLPNKALVEIDDSSGQTIEVKLQTVKSRQPRARFPQPQQTTRPSLSDGGDKQDGEDEDEEGIANEDEKPQSRPATTMRTFEVDTTIDNIKVTTQCTDPYCRERHITLDGKILEVQDIIRAKGKIGSYNGTKQIELERAFLVRTTDEEVQFWEKYSSFCMDVLCKPWVLDKVEMRRLERKDRERLRANAAEQRRQDEKSKVHGQVKQQKRERRAAKEAEAERRRQLLKPELDGCALDQPKWKRDKYMAKLTNGTKEG